MRATLLLIWLPWISACADDPGRRALERLECGACHVIPGVSGARGQVGPPLDAYGKRVYIAGKLPRDKALLARWVADAPSLSPGTAMPKIPMSDAEARAIADYLSRLQ
jgi:cytochrome c1